MTFEQFSELAVNSPKRDVRSVFEVIEYDVRDLPEHRRNHYPKFDVEHHRVGISMSLSGAESLMHEAISVATKNETEIYCFHIKEYPLEECMPFDWEGYGLEWRLYDAMGRFLDKTYCSGLERDHGTEYGRYRGRPEESFRFKAGDIVEVLDGDEVRLAVATGAPLSIEWYWEYRERIKAGEGLRRNRELTDKEIEDVYLADAGDDQVPVIDGPSYSFHDHVHILNIMPLRYPLSKKLRSRYEGFYNAMLEEEKF